MSLRRHPLGWSQLAHTRVGLWGLGVEGGANLRRLRGLTSDITVAVDRAETTSVDGIEVLEIGRGGLDALARCDVVVKTPGVSRRLRPEVAQLQDRGIPVVGGLGLWMHEVPRERVVCITGTKGKSTTVSVLGHLLFGLGRSVFVGGNIGRPPYDPDLTAAPGGTGAAEPDLWVIETSSFQVTDLAESPPVVAVTSLSPDHLDWHGTLEHYYADKLSLCSQPGARVAVVDGTCGVLRAWQHALGPAPRWIDAGPDRTWARGLGLMGSHNLRNTEIARACIEELGIAEAGDEEAMAAAAEGFAGLESRLHRVWETDSVQFVDDGLATNVLPAMAAVDAFATRRVGLLVGGHDRGIDYRPLGEHLAGRSGAIRVCTMPDNGPRIAAQLREAAPDLEVVECADLEEAVEQAYLFARPDGVVLLSPAAPSFGRFRDYRERSAAFLAAARRCGPGAGS